MVTPRLDVRSSEEVLVVLVGVVVVGWLLVCGCQWWRDVWVGLLFGLLLVL